MWLASSRSLKYETNVKRFWIFSDGRGSPGEVIEVKIKGCDGCYEGGGDGDNGAAAGISPFNSQTLKTADRDLIGRRKWRKPGKL